MAIGMMLNLVLLRRPPTLGEALLYSVAIGGLTFLNAWDGAIYLFGMIGAEALRRLLTSERGQLTGQDWLGLIRFGAMLALIAFVAYLPYFVGFRSQAGGLLPNLLHPTLFRRFFLMFGPLVLIVGAYLLIEVWRGAKAHRLNWGFALKSAGSLLLALAGTMILLGLLIALGNPNQPRDRRHARRFRASWRAAGSIASTQNRVRANFDNPASGHCACSGKGISRAPPSHGPAAKWRSPGSSIQARPASLCSSLAWRSS